MAAARATQLCEDFMRTEVFNHCQAFTQLRCIRHICIDLFYPDTLGGMQCSLVLDSLLDYTCIHM